jgi:hypothetical protein
MWQFVLAAAVGLLSNASRLDAATLIACPAGDGELVIEIADDDAAMPTGCRSTRIAAARQPEARPGAAGLRPA